MTPRFDTVTIIGVGLLGGSLGLAMKARGMAGTVRGVGHRASSLEQARAVGAVDETYLDPLEAVPGADLIVVCTPAALVPGMLDTIRPVCSSTAIVTDVASTKAAICEHARNTWPAPTRFVGSHPMAGSEKFGPRHAFPELYEDCVTIVETGGHIAQDAREAVCALWRALGAEVIEMAPDVHDAGVARTSHLPHVAAAALAMAAIRADGIRPLIGQGFRDTTRIAASRPEVWRDICLTNSRSLVEALDELIRNLGDMRNAIDEGNAAQVEAFFREARSARLEVVDQRIVDQKVQDE
ncbi:MAG: prephenate dehydrogenase/arogenate dehydrogenase family protein [Nitrospiraceae bacterium]|nr:prephenate dehydrogenase/arogenate dehydrogenase family protein [Nitrospiraceae bacterium]